MTNWLPNIAEVPGPRYAAIAESLAHDIAAGRLKSGDRLPTHRELAWRLGVTVGTVTRAYAEAERRGLAAGEVGRGTFVRDPASSEDLVPRFNPPAGFVDLARSLPPDNAGDRTVADALGHLAHGRDVAGLLSYGPNLGWPQHRAAGAEWVERCGVGAKAGEIAVTSGAQHGMMLAMSALARPGEVVLSEQLTFYGMKALATHLSLRLHGVALDQHGILPDALDAACRQLAPKALYLVPTLHNPTTAILPAERRAEIVEICRRYAVAIVEDDIYGFLPDEAPSPIAALAPDITIYVSTMSKCVAPGMRLGFVRASAAIIDKIGAALRSTSWMASPILAELGARLIRSGDAARLSDQRRVEASARQAIARRVLAGHEFATHERSYHLWLTLPEPWRREEFTALAQRRGVGVAPAEAFAVGRAPAPHAVRLGLTAARDRAELERALGVIVGILGETPNRGLAEI